MLIYYRVCYGCTGLQHINHRVGLGDPPTIDCHADTLPRAVDPFWDPTEVSLVEVATADPGIQQFDKMLVGGFNPLKNMKVSWMIIPYMMENKKCLKPPTRYIYIYI